METVDVKLPSALLRAANLEEGNLFEDAARLLALELYRSLLSLAGGRRYWPLPKPIVRNVRKSTMLPSNLVNACAVYFSGNSPGIQREANAAGKTNRHGSRAPFEASTPRSFNAATTRRAWRS